MFTSVLVTAYTMIPSTTHLALFTLFPKSLIAKIQVQLLIAHSLPMLATVALTINQLLMYNGVRMLQTQP